MTGQTLSLSYGRCIAEFLNEESLVHLGLLDLSTCVGFGTGGYKHKPVSFSGQHSRKNSIKKTVSFLPSYWS